MEAKFFLCRVCGNVIVKLVDSNIVPVCCGKPMTLLEPNTSDGNTDYHLPAVSWVDNNTLKVEIGDKPHPAMHEHHICFIFLEMKHGGQFITMKLDVNPCATFCCCKDQVRSVYAYCNLHGLWKLDL
ncbi:MAG: hypothetical protein MJZ69_10185 [Bacteroidaceae bacterium]|nr:hypothetical protein [Candidatus Minthousia equi]MCQ2247134.1 hypothetical protein [Bacteroidaceae bacterium]MDO4956838.1 desulfoferrodoxin family protein [Bacteroidales bacterium]